MNNLTDFRPVKWKIFLKPEFQQTWSSDSQLDLREIAAEEYERMEKQDDSCNDDWIIIQVSIKLYYF